MPQMAPYNWTMLFIMFNMIMIFYISNNHFYPYFQLKKSSSIYKNFHNYKWKW